MPLTRITGRNLVVKFAPVGQTEAQAVTISSGGRGFTVDESDDELDVTGYNDPGRVTAPAGYPRRSATITVAYEVGDPNDLLTLLAVGNEGTLYWYREGIGTGKPKEQMDVWISSRSRPMPHNEQMVMNVTFSATSGITSGTQA
jgi:transcription elongation factor